jgi:hypothetical protein
MKQFGAAIIIAIGVAVTLKCCDPTQELCFQNALSGITGGIIESIGLIVGMEDEPI